MVIPNNYHHGGTNQRCKNNKNAIINNLCVSNLSLGNNFVLTHYFVLSFIHSTDTYMSMFFHLINQPLNPTVYQLLPAVQIKRRSEPILSAHITFHQFLYPRVAPRLLRACQQSEIFSGSLSSD